MKITPKIATPAHLNGTQQHAGGRPVSKLLNINPQNKIPDRQLSDRKVEITNVEHGFTEAINIVVIRDAIFSCSTKDELKKLESKALLISDKTEARRLLDLINNRLDKIN